MARTQARKPATPIVSVVPTQHVATCGTWTLVKETGDAHRQCCSGSSCKPMVRGDILLADRYYCSYFMVALLPQCLVQPGLKGW